MKVLIYAGSEFMTSDAIADAVLRYSEALAEGREAGTIDLPVVEVDGTLATATFLVGPSSQLVAKDVITALDQPDAPEVVEHIEALIRGLHPTAAIDTEPYSVETDWNWSE